MPVPKDRVRRASSRSPPKRDRVAGPRMHSLALPHPPRRTKNPFFPTRAEMTREVGARKREIPLAAHAYQLTAITERIEPVGQTQGFWRGARRVATGRFSSRQRRGERGGERARVLVRHGVSGVGHDMEGQGRRGE